MWQLRQLIDVRPILEGNQLGSVMKSHAATFASIMSLPTEFAQTGNEPLLTPVTRGMLFSRAYQSISALGRHQDQYKSRLSGLRT